jgi:GTP-binding protein
LKAFPDEAEITVHGGDGGPGGVSFHRTRREPRGRPDGGDGGPGGDVILEASPHQRDLAYFKTRRILRAPKGQPGGSRDCAGKSGPALLITVPLGTLVYDRDSGELLAELLHPGDRLVAARGGRGGKGNAHFVSSRLRSPRFAQPGEKGETRHLRLELQILADVGLMGAPNAGKTTLLKALTASRARVGDFPFTTLSPQLGVLPRPDHQEPLILAEIPGLIPGAHLGKGLGHRFLRHLGRTRLLLQVVDLTQVDPARPLTPLTALEEELRAFDPALMAKPRIIVLNKVDLLPPEYPLASVVEVYQRLGHPVAVISAATGQGLAELHRLLESGPSAVGSGGGGGQGS